MPPFFLHTAVSSAQCTSELAAIQMENVQWHFVTLSSHTVVILSGSRTVHGVRKAARVEREKGCVWAVRCHTVATKFGEK